MRGHIHRGAICLERAKILIHESFPGNQFILRVSAPRAATRAQPGSFAHIRCDEHLPMRRPLSIMRANEKEGWLEFLYKPVGAGLARLARKQAGDILSVLAPIGRPFEPDPSHPRLLAIGGGVGIPPMIFLADRLRQHPKFSALVLMGSELPFPFRTAPASLQVSGIATEAAHGLTLLEQWGIPSRLASNAGIAGAWRGHVTGLADSWLQTLSEEALGEVQIVACGPEPMLRATAVLARRYGRPCQIALEEYMACGVGGCAGCTVRIETAVGPAMKRVCVDGPVFDALQVYPPPN